MEDRRCAVVEVSGQLLVDIFKEGPARTYRVVRNGIPKDGRIAGASYDAVRDVWAIAVESEQFEPVPEYLQLPVLPPVETETVFVPEAEARTA